MSVINSIVGSRVLANVDQLPLPGGAETAPSSLSRLGFLSGIGQTPSSISSSNTSSSNRPARRFEHFKIVVNVPIQFKGEEEARAVMSNCLEMLEGAGSDNFQFLVVFGLNCSEEEQLAATVEKTAKTVEETAKTLNAELNITELNNGKWRNIDSVDVLGYRWKPAKGEINFVQFRNQLLYSPETRAVIDNAKERAQQLGNSTVRLLSLDPDTEIRKEAMEELAAHWQDKEAAVITAGFYEYDLPKSANDVENLELLSIRIENVNDRAGKKALSGSRETLKIQHEPMPLDLSELVTEKTPLEPQLKRIISRSIIVLGQCKEKSPDVLRALSLYEELKGKLRVFMTAAQRPIKAADLIRKEMALSLDAIRQTEARFKVPPEASLVINGRDILYPPECALFVSLYEDESQEEGKESNKMELWDAHMRARPEKRWDLWGTQGRGEGANLSMQVQRVRRSEAALRSQESRPAIDFPWSFVTAIPARNRLDKMSKIVIQNLRGRGLIGDIIEILYRTFLYKSQSFLSRDFATQRVNFVRGSSVREPKSFNGNKPIFGNFSPYGVGVRDEVASVVKRWIPQMQEEYRALALRELEMEVLRLFDPDRFSRQDLVQSLINAVCNTSTPAPHGRKPVVVYSDDILKRILSYLWPLF